MTHNRIRFIFWFSAFLMVTVVLLATVVLDTIYHRFDFPFGGLYSLVVELCLLAVMVALTVPASEYRKRWND